MQSVRYAGLFLIALGAASILLYVVGFNVRYLRWVDMWGVEIGFAIRIAIVFGGILLTVGASLLEEEPKGGSEI